VLPAHCPDPFHFIEVITSVIVLLKKVCSIIAVKRIQNLTGERIFDRIVGFCFVLRSIKRLNYKGSWRRC